LPGDTTALPIISKSLDEYAERRSFSKAGELLTLLRTHPFDNGQWAFRGHTRADYFLQPSIERIFDAARFPLNEAEELVGNLFRARAHHYVVNLPPNTDELEWLSLMRHHGAPTRLLDWTVSPYVAAFFATCERAPALIQQREPRPTHCASAIWAINAVSLKEAARKIISSGPGDEVSSSAKLGSRAHFNRIFLSRHGKLTPLIAPVRPVRMNERLTDQRGLFLCASTLEFGFEAILKKMLADEYAVGGTKTEWFYKLEIEPSARLDVLTELRRMNITYGSLFPGLDGFARSMQTYLEIKAYLRGQPKQIDDVL